MSQKSLLFCMTFMLSVLLSACQTLNSPLLKSSQPQPKVIPEESNGNYELAAQKYFELAQTQPSALAAHYFLRSAEIYSQIELYPNSLESLSQINSADLSETDRVHYELLSAKLSLHKEQGREALEALDKLEDSQLSKKQQLELLQLRSTAYYFTENWLEKANTHIAIAPLLSSDQAIKTNNESLWFALMKLSPQALDLFNPGVPPAEGSGWFALAHTIKAYQTSPEVLYIALEDWKRSYPNHPADPSLYETILASGTHLPSEITNIAVLLPGSGPYAKAARAIKDGIIAEHFSSGTTSQLKFFDITVDSVTGQSDVEVQYQRAIDAGANIVIGPLQKQSVDEMALIPELTIPVLALNRIEDQLNRPNLFQFGLAPEDDAISVADYALAQGYKRAVILSPEGDWGNRIANAFNQQWQQNGGQTLRHSTYSEIENDFSTTLIPLMGLDVSKQRYQKLKSLLGLPLEFEPRRRQDIDFVLLIAKPLKARQLVPQLRFHRSGDLPIISTSHAYSGQVDPQQDIDLNGLIITDMPWMLSNNAELDPSYIAVTSRINKSDYSLLRLTALGVDAYRLIPQLNKMSRDPELHFEGATGTLSINTLGQIQRNMPWAHFNQGYIQQIK